DGELVGDAGLPGEELGDVEAGHARANRLPDAAIFFRGLGLHVVEVDVAGAAVEPEEDDGGLPGRPADLRGLLASAEDLRQADAGHAGDADGEEAAAIETVAILRAAAKIESKHGDGTS